MSSGNACGLDGLPVEIFKHGGRILVEKLTQLYSLIWQHEAVPKDFKDATIIHLYKRKGDHSILLQSLWHFTSIYCRENHGSNYFE